MSGFFLVRPAALDLDALRPDGFKILLEILVSAPYLSTCEVSFAFADRHSGSSKAGCREGLRYGRSLASLRLRTLPASTRPGHPTVGAPTRRRRCGRRYALMSAIGLTLLVVLTAVLLGIATLTLVWMLDAWKTPTHAERTRFVPDREPRLSFSLIVPARHEQAVLGDTLDQLAAPRPSLRRGARRRRPRRRRDRRRSPRPPPDGTTTWCGSSSTPTGPRTSRRRSTPRCPSAAATSSACSTPRTRSPRRCCAGSTPPSARPRSPWSRAACSS